MALQQPNLDKRLLFCNMLFSTKCCQLGARGYSGALALLHSEILTAHYFQLSAIDKTDLTTSNPKGIQWVFTVKDSKLVTTHNRQVDPLRKQLAAKRVHSDLVYGLEFGFQNYFSPKCYMVYGCLFLPIEDMRHWSGTCMNQSTKCKKCQTMLCGQLCGCSCAASFTSKRFPVTTYSKIKTIIIQSTWRLNVPKRYFVDDYLYELEILIKLASNNCMIDDNIFLKGRKCVTDIV